MCRQYLLKSLHWLNIVLHRFCCYILFRLKPHRTGHWFLGCRLHWFYSIHYCCKAYWKGYPLRELLLEYLQALQKNTSGSCSNGMFVSNASCSELYFCSHSPKSCFQSLLDDSLASRFKKSYVNVSCSGIEDRSVDAIRSMLTLRTSQALTKNSAEIVASPFSCRQGSVLFRRRFLRIHWVKYLFDLQGNRNVWL